MTTATEPLQPAERGEQTTTDPYPDPCIIDGQRHDDWILAEWPDNQGTTEYGFVPCSRPGVDAIVGATPTLPETGYATMTIGMIAVGAITIGMLLRRIATDRQGDAT